MNNFLILAFSIFFLLWPLLLLSSKISLPLFYKERKRKKRREKEKAEKKAKE